MKEIRKLNKYWLAVKQIIKTAVLSNCMTTYLLTYCVAKLDFLSLIFMLIVLNPGYGITDVLLC